MKAYKDMTDDEARDAVKKICSRCERFTSDEEANAEVKRLMVEELGYEDIPPSVDCISDSSGQMTMRSFMVLFMGPSGKIIQI